MVGGGRERKGTNANSKVTVVPLLAVTVLGEKVSPGPTVTWRDAYEGEDDEGLQWFVALGVPLLVRLRDH